MSNVRWVNAPLAQLPPLAPLPMPTYAHRNPRVDPVTLAVVVQDWDQIGDEVVEDQVDDVDQNQMNQNQEEVPHTDVDTPVDIQTTPTPPPIVVAIAAADALPLTQPITTQSDVDAFQRSEACARLMTFLGQLNLGVRNRKLSDAQAFAGGMFECGVCGVWCRRGGRSEVSVSRSLTLSPSLSLDVPVPRCPCHTHIHLHARIHVH